MKNLNPLILTAISLFLATPSMAQGFDAELQCEFSSKGAKSVADRRALVKTSDSRLTAEMQQEITLTNGATYQLTARGFMDSMTTNTNALTLSQVITIQEKDAAFKTVVSSGPTMFRMESFSDLVGGYLANSPRALCNMFNCSEIRADIGVSHEGSISVVCQIRGK